MEKIKCEKAENCFKCNDWKDCLKEVSKKAIAWKNTMNNDIMTASQKMFN